MRFWASSAVPVKMCIRDSLGLFYNGLRLCVGRFDELGTVADNGLGLPDAAIHEGLGKCVVCLLYTSPKVRFGEVPLRKWVHHSIVVELIRPILWLVPVLILLVPVSYTHLDVYKRQAPRSRGARRSGCPQWAG